MVPEGMIPYEDWDFKLSRDQANALKWRYMYILRKKAFTTRGAVILAQKKPSWFTVGESRVDPKRDVVVGILFKKHNKVRTGCLGTTLVPFCIQKGNPDIAWLYSEVKDYYVPIQAAFLAVIIAVYGKSFYFTFRRAKAPIWVRSESSNRRIMRNNIVGIVREYRVDKTKLPFRVPVEFCWF
jgi:hypothetical protein